MCVNEVTALDFSLAAPLQRYLSLKSVHFSVPLGLSSCGAFETHFGDAHFFLCSETPLLLAEQKRVWEIVYESYYGGLLQGPKSA